MEDNPQSRYAARTKPEQSILAPDISLCRLHDLSAHLAVGEAGVDVKTKPVFAAVTKRLSA